MSKQRMGAKNKMKRRKSKTNGKKSKKYIVLIPGRFFSQIKLLLNPLSVNFFFVERTPSSWLSSFYLQLSLKTSLLQSFPFSLKMAFSK